MGRGTRNVRTPERFSRAPFPWGSAECTDNARARCSPFSLSGAGSVQSATNRLPLSSRLNQSSRLSARMSQGGGSSAAHSQSPPSFHPHGPIRGRPKRRKRSRANRKRSTEAPEAELQNAGKRSSGKDEALGSGLAGRFEGPSGALRSGAFPGAVPGGAAAARTAQPGPPPRHRAAHGTAAARGGAGRNPPLSPSPRSPFISLPVSLWLPVSL